MNTWQLIKLFERAFGPDRAETSGCSRHQASNLHVAVPNDDLLAILRRANILAQVAFNSAIPTFDFIPPL